MGLAAFAFSVVAYALWACHWLATLAVIDGHIHAKTMQDAPKDPRAHPQGGNDREPDEQMPHRNAIQTNRR